MENGKIYLDTASLYIYNHSVSLGMSYADVTKLFVNFIKCTKELTKNDQKTLVIELYNSYIYDIESNIYLYFKAGKVDKIKINILTDHITVVSEHTGQELYKDKLKQAVIEFKTAVIKQYFGPVEAKKVFNNYYNKKNASIKDLMFQIKNKQYVFYNTWSPNEDLCTIIFKNLT